MSAVNRTQGYCTICNKVPTTPQTLLFIFYYQCVATRNRTWVFSATTKSTNHYTITTNTIISTVCRNCGSNTGPSDLQSDALPTELFRLKFFISCFMFFYKDTTTAGLEPARAKHNGLAVHLLNHSDMSSSIE